MANVITSFEDGRDGWSLDDEGTLLVVGDRFDGIQDPRIRNQVRRIVLRGVTYVPPRTFEGFDNCWEVDFELCEDRGYDFGYADEFSFAHCRSLYWFVDKDGKARTWGCDMDGDMPQSAVLGTPFQEMCDLGISVEAIPFLNSPLHDTDGTVTAGIWGKRFLSLVESELLLMAHLRVPDYVGPHWYSRFREPPKDRVPWFRDCLRLLACGAEVGEPAMLYLAAEYARHARWGCGGLARLDDAGAFEGKDPTELYLAAAQRGSLQAKLWCAFCMEDGRNGMPKDPLLVRDYLKDIRELQTGSDQTCPIPLSFGELEVLRSRHDYLIDSAFFGNDLEENHIMDRCCYEPDRLSAELWNPSFHATCHRACWITDLAMDLGLSIALDMWYPCDSYVSREEVYPNVRTYDELDMAQRELRAEKDEWLAWCRSRGLSVTM